MNKHLKLLIVMTIATTAANSQTNPLLEKWQSPYGAPPLATVQASHYTPAIHTAISQAQSNINQIAKQKAPATFDNTILALEYADTLLQRVSAVLFNLNECNTNAELQSLVMKLSPEITRFENSVWMNEQLYKRVEAVYAQRDQLGLNEEQLMLLDNCHKRFVRNGVGLKGKDKKRFAANNEELAKLTQQFNSNVLADNNSFTLHVTNEAQLRGLPERDKEEAHAEAVRRGKGGWLFTLQQPSYLAIVTHCDDRSLRETMWRAYNSRGNHAGKSYNGDIVKRIAQLRMEQAKMLGYDTYADYVLDDRMAHDRKNLTQFMTQLIEAAYPEAREDVHILQVYASRQEPEGFVLQPWDVSYYAEKLRQHQFNFDEELLRPYFQLEKVRQGIFDLYGRLYGLGFKPNNSVPVYHPDVKVFEVWDSQRFMGLLYLDMFPREGKRNGAWMTEFRGQYRTDGHDVRPLIQVVCNFTRPVGDTPSLLSLNEVSTFMHEMGHAMHGMLSDVGYESLSGTSVKRDFVELPSQLMENWCYEPQFLATFASHYKTGKPMPTEYIERVRNGRNFMAGYYCSRQLGFASIDMAYHTITEPLTGNIEEFERQNNINLLPAHEGCLTSTAFTHIFAGGYAAGYYGYKWAEILDADVFSLFQKEGIFNANTASRLRSTILSKGGTRHPAALFKDLMGREPKIDAYLIRSGFIQAVDMPTEQGVHGR
ncbi:MAG: M3 family metallopeptidase [Bacteroidales bacterium]|nr:M3 family metallopeptidase [Bacteroidales bacterium]MBQ9588027.1 M3 family metallopeptidase [Bacteroidales bacterium]